MWHLRIGAHSATSWEPELPKQTNLPSPRTGSRGQRYEILHPGLQRGSMAEKILSPTQISIVGSLAVSEWSKSAVPVSCGICFVAASWSGVMTNLFSLICYWTIKTYVDTQKNTMTGDNRALSKQLSKFHLAWRGCTNTTQSSSCGRSEVASGSLTCPGLLGVSLVPQQSQQQKKDKFSPWAPSILPL